MSRGPHLLDGDVALLLGLLAAGPLTRKELVAAMQKERDMSDSSVRIAIEEARAQGQFVIHDGESYRIAASYEELEGWIARDAEPRAHRILEQVAAMRRRAEVTWPHQMTLTEAA